MIVIDPGHGGKDSGVVRGALVEKSVTLAVGLKLRDLLEDAGIACAMTRDQDEYLALSTRGALARKHEARLVVSLHVNASVFRARGLLALHLKSDATAYLRAEQIARNVPGPLVRRKRDTVQPATLLGYPRARNVLRSFDCPAVLVEMGFATDVHDNAYLLTDEGQVLVAGAIAAGVVRMPQPIR